MKASPLVLVLLGAVSAAGCQDKSQGVRVRFDKEASAEKPLTIARGQAVNVECYAEGTGDRYTTSYCQGTIQVAATSPEGIKITPKTWQMEMTPNTNRNQAKGEFRIEVSTNAPLGKHTIEFEVTRKEGVLPNATMVVEVIASGS